MEEYYESSLCPVAFFTELDVLRALSKTEYHVVKDPIDFSVDLIHAPFHMTFTEEPYTEYACYTRNELGPCEEPDFSLKNTGDEEPKLQTGTDFDELPVAGVMLFYLMKLKEYVHDNGIIQQYVGMDPAREGVLLYRFGDEIRHKLVSGKQRPDLMCKTLFQGDAMKRPYEDEISSAWDEELLPFAKKLEAAENGDVEMMKAVSKACRNGEDDDSAKVEMDPEKAAFWMEQAAENADAEAMHDVGLFYARGYGVKRDFRSAAKWMDRAAEEGVYGAYEKAVEYHKAEDAQQRAESGDPQGMGD